MDFKEKLDLPLQVEILNLFLTKTGCEHFQKTVQGSWVGKNMIWIGLFRRRLNG